MKMHLNTIKLTVVFMLLWAFTSVYGQLSKVHYIPPLPSANISNGRYTFDSAYIYISTPESLANFTIKPLGSPPSEWFTGSVTKTNSYKRLLDREVMGAYTENFTSTNVFNDKGYQIISDKEIYVSVRVKAENHAGAVVSKGLDGYGKRFRVAGMERTGAGGDSSFFSIISTEDNNNISFVADRFLLTSKNTDLPTDLVLNKEEAFIVSFAGENIVKNIGTLITSTKDIVVTTGTMYGSFSNEIIESPDLSPYDNTNYFTGGDMGIDQLVSINPNVDAKEYIIVKGDSFNSIENALIIADEDDTQININGVPYIDPETRQQTLNAGDHFFIEGTSFSTIGVLKYMHITSEKNIYVFQGTGDKYLREQDVYSGGVRVGVRHNYSANQGMFFVPPLNCASTGDVESIARIDEVDDGGGAGGAFEGSVFVLSTSGSNVTLNGEDINTIANAQINVPIGGLDAYTLHRVDNESGDVSVVGSDELYVSYFNVNEAATSGAFYSGFTLEPKISPELSISTLGSCIYENGTSNVSFNISSASYKGFDEFKWQKKNQTTDNWENILGDAVSMDAANYTPDSEGQYRAVAKIYCLTDPEIFSEPIVVSFCPADFDQDGVIDNLDLDKDNDGIFNTIESYGDFPLNLTDVNAPTVGVPTGAPTTLISSDVTSNGATVSGDATGRLTSSFSPGTVGKMTAEFVFDNSVTLLFSYAASTPHTASDNESFVIESVNIKSPITLLNPNNELLIDTNLDGNYESDIQQFSASSIRFTFNSSVSFTGTYGFSFIKTTAGSSDGIVFSHEVNNNPNNSAFKANLTLVNYGKDSNGDGIFDEVELDSDGDGCPDYIEAGFTNEENPEKFGDNSLNVDTGEVNEDGTVAAHDYSKPISTDSAGNYYFQQPETQATLSQDFTATNAVLCEGEPLSLTFKSPDAEIVLWEVDTDADGIFESANTLGTIAHDGDTHEFIINNVTTTLDKAVFRARLSKSNYVCTKDTQPFTLTVEDNTTKPDLDPLTVVCNGATVADLNVADVVWYNAATGGSPLANDAVLAHNTPYFAASVVNGCIGELRSETKVVVNDPVISTVSGNTTFCAEDSVILSLDTNKILPAPDDFARINNLIYIENATGPVQYDNGFYYTQQGINSGVQPITWLAAKALGESIVGATLYIINSTAEEDAVYQGLQHMGLTGNDRVAFWLGLFQDQNASDYSEPYGGWYWVDGTPLTYENWWSNEPNDGGDEHYGQFEFADNGKFWNDMNLTFSGGQSFPVFEYKAQTNIEWFTVETNGAETPMAGVANSSQLEVSPLETTSYFVRVTTNGVVCDSAPFTVTINPLPVANTVSDALEICIDNSNGAIASTDLQGSFDLTSKEAAILGSQNDTNHAVAYYTSRDGAENEIAAAKILTPDAYTNTSNPQTIYYRVTNTDTDCVSDIGELTIKANALPPTITIPDFEACDDLTSGSDEDGILRFDLATQTAVIEGLLGNTTQWSISYHETVADAEAENAITEYTTSVSDTRTKKIVVRLEDNTTGCSRIDNTIDLVVLELPKISDSSFLREQCDTDTDGVVQDNLTLYNAFFSANHENETFTYYTDTAHDNQIINPEEFYNTSMNQMVYVKITNSNGCERTFDPATGDPLTIEIRVRASTIEDTFLETYYTCLDPSVKTNTGLSTFEKAVFGDLETALIAEHPAFANNNVTIQFYETESDAASKVNPIDTSQDYNNTTPNSQEIWAAVDANGLSETTCLGLKQVANFIVEPLAILHPVSIPRQCDGDSANDLNAQDGLFPFDTSTVMSQLLLGQNPADYNITFFDENDVVISTNGFPAEYLSPSQAVRVVVENNPSNVTPACYQEALITFTVDDSPEIGNYTLAAVCDNDDGVLDGLGVFDTTSLNAELLAGQSNMEIQFLQRDGAGNETILGNSLPNPFTTPTTTVVAQIYNPTNAICLVEEYLTFQVDENPVFELATDYVFCQNLGFDTISVTNPIDTYAYAWEQNGVPIPLQSTQDLIITEGGDYSVMATNLITGCTTTKIISVSVSEIALLGSEDVTIYDLTGDGSNRIEIDNSEAALGIGNYEFALKLNDAPIGLYQDNPVFENVPPGVHTLYAQDKNTCGVAELLVSVIGYPLFFTPNGDGKNDAWQILGVSAAFQPLSLIYIFDRHGRLMAQIPADGIGWDGTYNGSALPADDYWFRVKLQDGRSFTGHFSLVR